MMTAPDKKLPLSRTLPMLSTKVSGLDTVLGGGVPSGGLYLLQGLAGSGKTTLACQIGFQHARAGQKVVVFTLLGEAHVKMLSHFSNFGFFSDDVVGERIVFFSAYSALMQGGLSALLSLLVSTLAQEEPHILIVDGFRSIRNSSATDIALAEFMHSLNALVSSMNCTTFLLSPVEGNITDSENTLVDGVIELGLYRQGMTVIREIQVYKIRGSKHLLGKHVFEIAAEGITVYPRFEALSSSSDAPPVHTSYLSVGIPSWDARIGGGVIRGSMTCLLGSPGVGKTIMGLHFIVEGLANDENCLIVGFHESPDTLIHKAKRVGLDLAPYLASGRLKVLWQLPLEILIDDIASRILADVKERTVSRLLIDGAEGLDNLVMHPERSRGYLIALTNKFRLHGVTVYITQQLSYFRAATPEVTPSSSVLYENVMLLEYFARGAVSHRRVAVMKLRENAYDGASRLFTISEHGISVGDPISQADAVLAGSGSLAG